MSSIRQEEQHEFNKQGTREEWLKIDNSEESRGAEGAGPPPPDWPACGNLLVEPDWHNSPQRAAELR
ncbi:hypothetical protein Q5P01_005821 [Channa striata]|uniref:Uncharacterized protein n=1 Tax=Channa striata TaxID=64152 RepID=A0AA88NK41_CHASR|nr:hypothetical protein Q5P01_005821 [Channa striata]